MDDRLGRFIFYFATWWFAYWSRRGWNGEIIDLKWSMRNKCLWCSVLYEDDDDDENVPLTASVAVWLSDPAGLVATHLYLPACLAATLSMLKKLTRLLVMIFMSVSFNDIGSSLNVQVKFTGKSPLIIVQDMDNISPECRGSSPKENCRTCGITLKKKMFQELIGELKLVWFRRIW